MIDLANSLAKRIPHIKHIENAFIELKSDNFIFKIKGFHLTYDFSRPFTQTDFNIDLAEQILGVMYNCITEKKQIIFTNERTQTL